MESAWQASYNSVLNWVMAAGTIHSLAMRLVGTSGSLAGSVFVLEDGLTIHAPSPDTGDVRPLCRLRRAADGGFVLHAVDRQTSLFVNGLPVTRRELTTRDALLIGDSHFVVKTDEEPPSAAVLTRSAVVVRTVPAAPLPLEIPFDEMLAHTAPGATSREARDLAALMRVDVVLSSIRGLAEIDAALAGLLLDAVPAERVAFTGGAAGLGEVRSAWTAAAEAIEPIAMDANVIARSIQGRSALAGELDGRWIAVLPMMVFGRPTGAVWIETGRAGRLDEHHVRLLLAITATASVVRERAVEAARLEEKAQRLEAEINIEHNMVGRSKPMRTLFERIGRVARTDSTILLRGESGTGKELVARAAHRNSARAERPFIAINCAAIAESLLESELFGHERGAFTGAIGLKKGKLELADGGTLFLDEIGELPLALQAKLLRALQEREFERVGGTRSVRVDFRLLAATNRDLEAAVRAGTFRQDLFYRINVVTLLLPPLRDRKEDIPLLADYFMRKHSPRCGRRVSGLTAEAIARLEKHQWPGNVRELENVIEQALALGNGDRIGASDLPPTLEDASPVEQSLDYHRTVEQTKRDLIVRAFEQAGYSHAAAARLLGVHPNYLHRLMRTFNLRRTWHLHQ